MILLRKLEEANGKQVTEAEVLPRGKVNGEVPVNAQDSEALCRHLMRKTAVIDVVLHRELTGSSATSVTNGTI